jgi:hypothetical protein
MELILITALPRFVFALKSHYSARFVLASAPFAD